MHNVGFLAGQDNCTFGNKNLKIQKLSFKKYYFCFQCKSKCKLYYPIKAKNFFENFSHTKIEESIEVIKCNLYLKFNIN